ncbi:MAG: hypothetical protein IAB93_02150 [Bacteroidetes bacterium]|uniref:Uncharacterized protein n=1 Tax=Candidatus Merdivivens pullistercoris TaxID=2840873 RepID=A0A9D9I3X1_9BACT|nr:hypothetical protein [Candidatus Merdivivens pullistercoris]
MKKFLNILLFIPLFFLPAASYGQEYLQIVSLESDNGTQGVFTSAGMGEKKKDVEVNAIKSLFYTLFFQGVEGVADGKPLVAKPNVPYTNSFFNDMARYSSYVTGTEEIVKSKKTGNYFQGTFKITLRLRQLINDVRKNTHYDEMMAEQPEIKLPNPTIIVVPYKKEGESYQAILENDYDKRIAVSAVQRGFEDCGIKTIDLQARLDRAKRNAQYEENAGTADSNDKQLLESSGADVYVTVDLLKDVTDEDARVSLIMKAYETASGTIWASQDGWTNRFRTNDTDILCSYAVKDNLPGFLEQIIDNFTRPTRASLQISLSGMSYNSISDARGDDGRRVMDIIQDWLDRNSEKGEYHLQGIVDEKAIFDYVILPLQDENGYKMTPDKFAGRLRTALEEQGVYSSQRIEGNTIFLILEL